MAASSADGKTAVIVALVPSSSENAGKTADDMLKKQVEDLEQNIKGNNVSYTTNSAEVTFDGLDRTIPASITTMTADGSTLSIAEAIAEKDGNFLEIVAIGVNEDDVMNAFKGFKAKTA